MNLIINLSEEYKKTIYDNIIKILEKKLNEINTNYHGNYTATIIEILKELSLIKLNIMRYNLDIDEYSKIAIFNKSK